MTLETVFNFLGIILHICWATFGMLCALRWWQERKQRALTANMVNAAIVQLKDAHLTDIKAETWEEGFTQGAAYYHESGKEPAAFTDTAQTLNPYKENN